ncbi:MAG: GC-type dockerin domain-anchored protein, partial [Planctomycetota bacterium]
NESNPAFLGDYTRYDEIDFSIDVYVHALNFLGQNTPRPFILELIDYDTAQGSYPWLSVWVEFTWIDENDPGWHTFSAKILDTSSETLPAGWNTNMEEHGFGLPPGVTFTQILSGIDRIQYTTLEPGWFFTSSDYDVAVDNITISGVTPCVDTNGDGVVDIIDLLDLLSAWGTNDPVYDIAPAGSPDGTVDIQDLLALLAEWGSCS